MTMNRDDATRTHERWAQLRFAVVGPLLAAPPPKGQLRVEIQRLAMKEWKHPVTGEPTRFGFSTIERWFYAALAEKASPVQALRRKVREDAGSHRAFQGPLRARLLEQYERYRDWSYQLHHDNLAALVKEDRSLGTVPSYATVTRFMKANGLFRVKKPIGGDRPGAIAARKHFEHRETRSYEVSRTGALWHLDFHEGSRKVLLPSGRWATAYLLGILDDYSRLACHLQWYLHESAENLVHGLCQAFHKRGIPRALLTDNGSAMVAAETTSGLFRLGITHETTLSYSPEQNGKQESFWAQVEGRFMTMLRRKKKLTLPFLNEATLAWAEHDYHRKDHRETKVTPLRRFLDGTDVGRPSPDSEELQRVFTRELKRKQRRSDGTVTVEGVRFEVPSAYRHRERVWVRYARWDLTRVFLADPRTGDIVRPLFPVDKAQNADGRRRTVGPVAVEGKPVEDDRADELPPLLRRCLKAQDASGLTAPYLAKDESRKKGGRNDG